MYNDNLQFDFYNIEFKSQEIVHFRIFWKKCVYLY